ncbi:MAG: ABC transporter permease subunit [Lachnospiraceae bacterium]|jgi:ABC-type transport system involved in multi-copper enzyme maturation permease subunit|nr:ABC transporter permease subunit [Lachnospiraceae bacterium]
MKTLVRYEFQKILRKKSTLIILAVSLLVTAFFYILPILQYQTYDREEVIRGLAGIAFDRARYDQLSVVLTDDYICEAFRQYQELFENPDNIGYDGNDSFLIGDAYWNFVAPRENLLYMLAANYDAPGEITGLNRLPHMDLEAGAGFYQAREEKISLLLDTPSRQLSQAQKSYWQNLNSQVDIPLSYGYYKGWEIILESFELLMFALLAVSIVLAPVFAGEYQAGTDAVILSARYGKTRLVTAKILASFLFGLTAFTLHILAAFGPLLLTFGTDGWNLPLQAAGTTIPYPFTFMQAVLINLGILYLVLLAVISLTLLLSARMKSPYTVLMVLVPVLFLPMFLSPNGTTGLYNLTLFLLPYRASMPEIGKYISYQLGGLVFDVLSMRAIVYTLVTVCLLPLIRTGFRKHQVGA